MRVVWHRPGAIGDVIMTLNCVKPYKAQHPDHWLVYKAAPFIVEMLRPVMLEAGIDEVVTTEERVQCDKQFNLIGYPLHDGYPERAMARHLIEYFSMELGLGGNHEAPRLKLPPRRAFRCGDRFFYEAPEPPYITLHAASGWSVYKTWPLERWAWVCQELRKSGIRVVQIGGRDEPVVKGIMTRLGASFMESLSLLANADLHLGGDSWSNHATNIDWEGKGKVQGVILWGSSQVGGSGYPHNRNISLGLPCQPCFRQDPRLGETRGPCPNPPRQTYEEPRHACMDGISKEYVLSAVDELASCSRRAVRDVLAVAD